MVDTAEPDHVIFIFFLFKLDRISEFELFERLYLLVLIFLKVSISSLFVFQQPSHQFHEKKISKT